MVFEYNRKKSLNRLLLLLYKFVLINVFLFFLFSTFVSIPEGKATLLFVLVFGMQFLIYMIPLFFVHFFYHLRSNLVKFEIALERYILHFNDEIINIDLNEIISIEHYLSNALYNKSGFIVEWDRYHYYKLKTIKGDFILTFFVCENLENFVPESKMIHKKSLVKHLLPK